MARQIEYLVELQKVIERKYHCSATHRETVFVEEKTGQQNETVWRGFVEIFALIGHDATDICYAWQRIGRRGIRTFTILSSRVVDSPNRAVQAAIFVDAEKPAAFDVEILKQRIEAGKKALYEAEMNTEDLESIIETSRGLRERRQRQNPEK